MLNNFFKFFSVVFLLATFAFSSNALAQLVGGTTYPINGTEAPPTSFGSITTAATYLAANGVTGTGQVILELSTGYAGELAPVSITAITGTSATLGVTFRPALGYTALTSIAGAATPNQHAIRLAGCSYVTLDGRAGGVGSTRDWTIRVTGSGTSGLGQMAVRLDNTTGSMTGIAVRNLIMEGETSSTTGAIFQITGNSTNTISNITIEQNLLQSGATPRGYGITLAVASNVGNTGIIVRNNIIRQFYARGINLTGGFPGIEIYGNEIYHSAAVTQPSTIEFAAIYFSTTTSQGAKIYNNYIHDIQLTNGTTAANGIYFFNGNTSGAPIEIFNNRIQIGNGITATTFPIYGIRDNAVSGALFNIYFNSVLVDGIASAGTSNSAAFIKGVSNFINLKNNIFYNARSNSAGTGTHWGISINNTTFASINNNDYFADGTGGVLGTTTGLVAGNQTTLAGWKGVVTADGSSVSQIPNYVAGLKINTSIATQLESGGATGTGVATDFEGETRLSPPDIGADEFLGTGLDITPPAMAYTLLSNTSYIANRQLTVAISDPSNIATSPNGPVLYYKKKTDVSFVFDNAPVVAGSNYTFTINSASLGVAAGDTIQYYVAAMDLIGNSGTSPSGGSGTPPGSTPPATFNSYAIVTALALPYSQDFNASTTLPAGWGGTMSVTANHGTAGSNGLNRNLWSSATTGNSNTPIVGPIAATTQLEFDYRIVDYTSYPATATIIGASDVYNVRISTDDGATYTTVYTINQANHVVSTNFATVVVPLGAYAGFNGVIKWELQWGAGDYYFDIDNVLIRVPPVGPPNAATLVSPANGGTGISINTTLNWASGGGAVETGYRIYFGTDGGGVTPPTNIANNVDLGLVTAYTPASPLAYSTTYYWQIVPYNGSGNATGNVIWSFTTGPNPAISTFPYAEGFEGTSFPPYGYSTYGDKLWLSGSEAHSGLKAARIVYTPAGTGNLQTPSVILPATPNYRIKFWWKDDDITARPGDGPEVAGYDTTYFEISTNAGSSWTVLSLLSATSAQTSYIEVIQDLTSYAGQTVLFRWRDVSDGTFDAYGTGVDDITIEEIPSCTEPTALTTVGITNNSVNIGWTGAANVDIDYGTVGHVAGTGTVVPGVTTNPYTLGGLTSATSYDVFVRQNCGSGTYSVWVGPLNFTTACDPLAIPFAESFDGTTIPTCWSQTSTLSPRWTLELTNVAGGTPNEMEAAYTSGTGVTRLIAPPINTTGITSLKLSFKHLFNDYGAGITYKIQSSIDGITWTDEAYVNASGTGNASGTVNTTISNNLGSTTYIAWVLDGNHFQFDYWNIDDVVLSLPLANDVGTLSIDLAGNLVPGPVVPQATVKNFGTAANSFNVTMTITGGYASTKAVSSLAPGATQVVSFDSWNAALGSYTAQVYTQLGTDGDATNDTLYKNIGVYAGLYSSGSVYPTNTYLGSGVGAAGFLYSIGGNTTSLLGTECYKYNSVTDTWTPIAPLPSGRRVLTSANVGNFIYAIGGSDMASAYQSTVYKYDITLDSWTTVAPLPVATTWGKAVGYNNKIYFAGGVDAASAVLSTVYVYDVTANTWTAGTSMPGPKFGGAFSISGNKLIYVAGANATVISSDVYVGTIDNTDPLLIAWTTAAKYPGLEKQMYSQYAGSRTELVSSDTKNSAKSWLSTEAAVYPAGVMYRFDGAPWGTDGIIVAGGSPTSSWVPAIPNPTYVYTVATDTWVKQPDVPVPVLAPSLGTVNSGSVWKLIVASGLGSVEQNATQIYTVDLATAPTTFPLTVNVTDGWNMVSVPGVHPTNQNVSTWWPNRNLLADVYRWTTTYVPVTLAAPTQGYWMLHTGAQTYNTGDEWPAGGIQIVAHDPIPLTAGWNMIGGYENSPLVSGLTTTPTGLIVPGTVYGWTGTYSNATNLVPGFGYWILSTGNGVINSPTAADGSAKVAVQDDKSEWGKITITDASGKSYTLYSVNGEVNLDQYQMPPLPPTGMFDVRYGSNRKAENLKENNQTIEMRGLVYPVTVRAEKMGIKLEDETGKMVSERLKSGEEVTITNSSVSKLMVSVDLIPDVYALEQNYPNPFNPSTKIEFSIPEDVNNVTLTIYNALGQRVTELVNSKLEAGKYSYVWNASDVATGLYIYELRTDKFVSVKKMMLLK